MGQQQLLLVILVTIIVGIATVVAINTFGSAADAANLDAVRQDLATIASSAQGYYMKPQMLGGGGRSFEDFSFAGVAVPGDVSDDSDGNSDTVITNENGTYTITGGTGADSQELTIEASASSEETDDAVSFTATIEPNDLDIEEGSGS